MTDQWLPIGDQLSQEQRRANFGWYDAAPYGNADLGIRLLVPKVFHIDPVSAPSPDLSSASLKPLALFAAEPELGVYLQIQAMKLERDISAEHWIRYYMITAGYHPHVVRGLSPYFADSACDFEIEGVTFTGRLAARTHGDILFVIFAFAPKAAYGNWAELFGVSVVSFKPTGAAPRLNAEPLKALELSGRQFSVPESWQVIPATAPRGMAGMDLVQEADGAVVGWMRVKSVSRNLPQNMENQVESALDAAVDTGLKISKMTVNTGVDLEDSPFSGGFLQVYDAETPTGLQQEYWIVVLEDEDYYFVITLLSPNRIDQFLIWARNRRALGIVMETMR